MLIKVEANELRIGMYVAELDRPWLDTPFLLQGFLVEEEEQLALLRHYCAFVFVDRERSAAGLFPAHQGPAFTAAEELRLTETGRFKAAVEVNPQSNTPEGSALLEPFSSILQRLGDMFGKRDEHRRSKEDVSKPGRRPENDESPPPKPLRHGFIPPSVELTYHPETKVIEEEIGSAREAYILAQELTHQMVGDIRSGKIISIDRIEEVIHDVVDSMVRNPDALMWVARLKQQDTATYGHGLQVAVYLVALGRYLSLPKEHLARLGTLGLLLDIGKTKLPRTLLAKPGTLTKEEFDLIRKHVQLGVDLLRNTPNLHPEILDGLAQHHEREDGSGYPNGLNAGRISLFGRMAAIVDTFVALTNVRPYAEAFSPYETLRKLTLWSGKLFHKPLVEQLVQAIGVFPVGSLVELSTGEIAVVVRQSKVRRLKPRLLVICGPDKLPVSSPGILDLLYQSGSDIEPVRIIRGLPAGAYGLDAREYYLS